MKKSDARLNSILTTDFTQVLNAVAAGDSAAAGELLPLVYDELRRLARYRMSQESSGHTLQATALVHEAWIRLTGSQGQSWQNRNHFFAAAAEAMRRILVEHARRKKAQKRGGGVAPEELHEAELVLQGPPEEILDLNDALDRLAEHDALSAELVKYRYFLGMTMDEAAGALNLSVRTAERTWAYAKAWLMTEIRRKGAEKN